MFTQLFASRLEKSVITAAVTKLASPLTFKTNSGATIVANFYSHCVWMDESVPDEGEFVSKKKERKEEKMEEGEGPATAAELTSNGLLVRRLLTGAAVIQFDNAGVQEYAR